jgi:hypothetical protein
MRAELIAPCGMNCAVCYAYLREKNRCPGCRLIDQDQSVAVRKCVIRLCTSNVTVPNKFCYSCSKYPCQRLKNLDKRYRNKYGMSMLKNLMEIKNSGIMAFLKKESIKWKCKECGAVICVHRNYCLNCHAERQIPVIPADKKNNLIKNKQLGSA